MQTERLTKIDRPAMRAHFLALGLEERRRRFGFAARDSSIERYVTDIDFERDAVFGVRQAGSADQAYDGIAHLALGWHHAELGVSVLKSARGCGIGTALLSSAALQARNCGLETLFMQNLNEICGMIRIAKALGMKVVTESSEAAATLPLQSINPKTLTRAEDIERIALYDATLLQTVLPPLAVGWQARPLTKDARAAFRRTI